MSYVFLLLFLAAVVGIFRPYVDGLNRSHFAIVAVVSFFLVGIFAPKSEPNANGANAAATPTKSTNAVASNNKSSSPIPAEAESKWEYSETRDQMRDTTAKLASITSENIVDLEFPYGEVHGELWIRKRPEDGLNVAFQVDKGQVLCHSFSDDDYISIKFDDGPIHRFRCAGTSDGSSETAFLLDESRMLAGLKRAKRTVVEAEFFQQGRQQFVFETAGLSWK